MKSLCFIQTLLDVFHFIYLACFALSITLVIVGFFFWIFIKYNKYAKLENWVKMANYTFIVNIALCVLLIIVATLKVLI